MSREKLTRLADEILELLPGKGWVRMISHQAGGKSLRVVFAKGAQRIVVSEDGAHAAISSTIEGHEEHLAALLKVGTKGEA